MLTAVAVDGNFNSASENWQYTAPLPVFLLVLTVVPASRGCRNQQPKRFYQYRRQPYNDW